MEEFKFRAECIQDVLLLREKLDMHGIKHRILEQQQDKELPDVEVHIEVNCSHGRLVELTASPDDDLHVIRQTLNTPYAYTGERCYAI